MNNIMNYAWSLLIGLWLFSSNNTFGQTDQSKPTDAQILNIIEAHRPLKGAAIPADIKNRIGATHVGGKYFFTDKPYLIEGAQKINELGLGVCKLWFYKNASGYPYNSDWKLSKDSTLGQLAKHPYYEQVFNLPFKTFVLSTSGSRINDLLAVDSTGLKMEEDEYYQLTKHLLQKYRQRAVTFILENWEGDWILRGGTGWDAQWGRVSPPADLQTRFIKMRNCFTARQKGVTRARKEVKGSLCNVYHAVEVNKVIDGMYGVPCLTTQVLPYIKTDMVAWSAYDATDFDKTGIDLYKGISFIKQYMNPTDEMKEKVVFLGEIGIPEIATKETPREFKERWDAYVGACLAQKVPYLIQWELYCNEPRNGKIEALGVAHQNTEMNGFWLIRPDGSKSYAMQYFDLLLQNAGRQLTDSVRKMQ